MHQMSQKGLQQQMVCVSVTQPLCGNWISRDEVSRRSTAPEQISGKLQERVDLVDAPSSPFTCASAQKANHQ